MVHTATPKIIMTMPLTINYTNGVLEVVSEFRWSNNQRVEIVYQRLGKIGYQEQEPMIMYHVSCKI